MAEVGEVSLVRTCTLLVHFDEHFDAFESLESDDHVSLASDDHHFFYKGIFLFQVQKHPINFSERKASKKRNGLNNEHPAFHRNFFENLLFIETQF